eukprot:scaffold396778_cov17-Prasinocladus_malaysianus.AAC.1
MSGRPLNMPSQPTLPAIIRLAVISPRSIVTNAAEHVNTMLAEQVVNTIKSSRARADPVVCRVVKRQPFEHFIHTTCCHMACLFLPSSSLLRLSLRTHQQDIGYEIEVGLHECDQSGKA